MKKKIDRWRKLFTALEKKEPLEWPETFKKLKQIEKKYILSSAKGLQREKQLFSEYRKKQEKQKKNQVSVFLEKHFRYYQLAAVLFLVLISGWIFISLWKQSKPEKGWEITHSHRAIGFIEGNETALEPGHFITAGSSVKIATSGVMGLSSGADSSFLIQGPAIIKLLDANAMALVLEMEYGTLFIATKAHHAVSFTLKTPHAEYTKKGTVARIQVGAIGDRISVAEGQFAVAVKNDNGKESLHRSVLISGGYSLRVAKEDNVIVFSPLKPLQAAEKKAIHQFQSGVSLNAEVKSMTISELYALYQNLQNVIYKDGIKETGYVYTRGGKWYLHGTGGIKEIPFEQVDKIETLEKP